MAPPLLTISASAPTVTAHAPQAEPDHRSLHKLQLNRFQRPAMTRSQLAIVSGHAVQIDGGSGAIGFIYFINCLL